MVKAVEEVKKDAYKLAMLSITPNERGYPDKGIFSAREAVTILNKYAEDGYELFSVSNYNFVQGSSETPMHFQVLYHFKLKE